MDPTLNNVEVVFKSTLYCDGLDFWISCKILLENEERDDHQLGRPMLITVNIAIGWILVYFSVAVFLFHDKTYKPTTPYSFRVNLALLFKMVSVLFKYRETSSSPQ